jgi:tagatose 1,6-diphosphate aldolase GatY/KbaY
VLASLTAVLAAARGSAGAFSCYDLVTADAVVRAAEARDAPCVLLIPPAVLARPAGLALVAGCRSLAAGAAVPVCVQLDHARDLEAIRAGLDAGANAVMADGAHLGFDDNMRFVARAVAMSDGHGAVCLAVSIGNVHGATDRTTPLDWRLLAEIRAATSVPLALHGGSGVDAADLRAAVAAGIGKVNVNAQLREAWLAATAAASRAGRSVLDVQRSVGAALEAGTAAVLDVLSG